VNAPALPLPALSKLAVPTAWRRIDFLSDLHLSPETPRTFDAWVAHMQHTDADAVFILGDLVEAWVGDDGRFDGFDARFTEAFTAVARLRPTHFMVGNRDFLIGHEMLQACGVLPLADPTAIEAFGLRGLLVHGDELCLDDTEYQAFRRQVRDPAWQRQALAQPLAVRRHIARAMREKSEAHQRLTGKSPEEWADVDTPTAIRWLEQASASFMLHGHTHRPARETLAPGLERHVLSDWNLEDADSGQATRPHPLRAEILRWTAEGFERRPPASAEA
jgi:UDP-2,3-diacylglucosamine hydrolase